MKPGSAQTFKHYWVDSKLLIAILVIDSNNLVLDSHDLVIDHHHLVVYSYVSCS